MLKNILLQTAQLINRDDIIDALNNGSDSQSINNDIIRLISYYNYTIETICENYFFVNHKQVLMSDKNRKISYLAFSFNPTKIISATKNGKKVMFSEYSKYLLMPEANTCYEIDYNYILDRVTELNKKITIPKGVSEKTICYGIASEFTASKNQPSESQFWKNKFMLEIFKSKVSKNRTIKKTYSI